MTHYCMQLLANISQTTKVYKDNRCHVLNRGLGSIINAIIIPTLITQQMLPVFSCPNFLSQYGCALQELLDYPNLQTVDYELSYTPPNNFETTRHLASSVLKKCHKEEHALLSAAARRLFFFYKSATSPTQIDVAVHIRNGDTLERESRMLVNKTNNATWVIELLKNIASPAQNFHVYSDECNMARPVAYAFRGKYSCFKAGGFHAGKTAFSRTESQTLIQDLKDMSHARLFVGSTRSNIPRLVFKMRNFKNVHSLPGQGWEQH